VLRERLGEVEGRIRAAMERAGRRHEDVTLIAVTKKFPASLIREAYEAGLRHFGENYVQEFEQKSPELSDLKDATFHLIGHLQSNKARKAAELFQEVDTVDSTRLATRLYQAGGRVDVMIEVKLSAEEAKSGAEPEKLPEIIDAIRGCENLNLLGLMTMPPWSEDAELSRPYFRRLRELAEQHGLKALSMGMSHDLEVGIEEGATHVRVGTALFGRRPKT
jgi:hypothetical protein